eukprot:gnl/MRDRNA2_/MRDRNA2_60080_c0_seq2.p1 gnl/MRDRNA2_/MRDRNA2_60080_c0~~gnl/MRDRNA2_/MRDRNA2_60080_c0_seq2.p1  ORF type:complete len:125 (+),score=47.38 gnl/MRDRNA2_/MRDRNA2_60080_c0_seq2:97-471(+)
MMRVAAFILAFVAAQAVDSSKLAEKIKRQCILGMLCWEDEDAYNQRSSENAEHQGKMDEIKKHIMEIQAEKDAREAAEAEADRKKKEERAINKKYCGCNFACGADDGSKCFDACCNDDSALPLR